jgi:diadenosine tetraphosphatase ApaH/serine/threonine PP2A family protein phosphatase
MFAVISDIHSNLAALTACVADIDREGVQRIACLGDVVGYGADPNPCVELVRERADLVVAGNHDYAAVGRTDIDYFNPDARAAILWTRGELTPESRAYLAGLPLHLETEGILLVHASPSEPAAWNYVRSLREAARELAAFDHDLCLIGHSHFPEFFVARNGGLKRVAPPLLVLRRGERALGNVGSVGQPRDGDPRAAYALVDPVERRVEIRRVDYDIESVRGRILNTALPASAADRLAWGL